VALNRKISWWLAILVLSRDVLLLTSAAVYSCGRVGYRLFQPSIYGKLTTGIANHARIFAVVLLAGGGLALVQFVRMILDTLSPLHGVFRLSLQHRRARSLGDQHTVRKTPRRCATNRRVCSAASRPHFCA